MKKNIKKTIIIVLVFVSLFTLCAISIFFFNIKRLADAYEPVVNRYSIQTVTDTMYLFQKAFGISANHSNVWLTKNSGSTKPDSSCDILFKDDEFQPIYYTYQKDSIILYLADSVKIPKLKNDYSKLIQIVLPNAKIQMLNRKYYDGRILKIIPIQYDLR